jgi:ATP:ADP antiporter, AAA family
MQGAVGRGPHAYLLPALLYTVALREDRYKAERLIDTVIYRSGDQVGTWWVTLLRAVVPAAAQVSFAAVPFGAI